MMSRSFLRPQVLFTAFLVPMLSSLAETPADSPIRSSLRAVGEVWQNTHGGAQTGGWWNTFVDAKLEVDGRAFGGQPSSTLFTHLHWVQNRDRDGSFSDLAGAYNPISNAMASDHLRVYTLYYRYMAGDEAWSFKAGQIAIDDDFMASEYAALFINSAFGPLPSQVATPRDPEGSEPAFPIFPVAAPGVFLKLHPAQGVAWQTGLYFGRPGPDASGNHGFAWRRSSSAGVAPFTELSTTYTVGRRQVSSRVGVGGHTGRFVNFTAANQDEDRTVRGLVSVYMVHDVVLARDSEGEASLGAFLRAGMSPHRSRSAVEAYVDAGVARFGPLASRPDDVAGVALSVSQFGRSYRALNALARREATLELMYQARLTNTVTLQADAQWLANPAAANADSGRRTDAFVLGLRSSFEF